MLARSAIGIVVVLVLAFVSHPLWLAPLLGRHLSATSGRSVHFDSVRIGLTPALAPVVHFRGVRIDNAPWAATQEPFVAFRDVVFVFDWRRFEGRRVVSYLLLRDGKVDLELRADGLRNWRLVDPEDRGPGHYWFFSLEGRDAALAFINHRLDLASRPGRPPRPARTRRCRRESISTANSGRSLQGQRRHRAQP